MATSPIQHRTVEHEPSALTRWLLVAAALGSIGAVALPAIGDGREAGPARDVAARAAWHDSADLLDGYTGLVAGATGVAVAQPRSTAASGSALGAWYDRADLLDGCTGLVAAATGLAGWDDGSP